MVSEPPTRHEHSLRRPVSIQPLDIVGPAQKGSLTRHRKRFWSQGGAADTKMSAVDISNPPLLHGGVLTQRAPSASEAGSGLARVVKVTILVKDVAVIGQVVALAVFPDASRSA